MAPNPIDFDQVFTELKRIPETGNVAVIIAVSCVFGLYLLLLLWARKNDKRDLLKVSGFLFTFFTTLFEVIICRRYVIVIGVNLLAFYHCSLIGYATHYLFCDR